MANTLQATAIFWDEYDEISQWPEDYIKWYQTSRNYDEWKYDALVNVLKDLKEGRKVTCPATQKDFHPTPYILFDAPLGYLHQATGRYIDFLVCLDTPLDIALARRLLRDYQSQKELSQLLEELNDYLAHSRPLFILPKEHMESSDLIIDGSLSIEEQEKLILNAVNNMNLKRKTQY